MINLYSTFKRSGDYASQGITKKTTWLVTVAAIGGSKKIPN